MQSLAIRWVHLSFKSWQMSCIILILFRIIFPVSKLCRPWSDATFCGVWSGSAPFPMSILWDARYIWFNTIRFYCISGNHRHVFPEESTNQVRLRYLLLIFMQCEKEKGLRIRISDWSVPGDTKHIRQCIPGMHLVVRSLVLHTPVYQKCKQNLSKRLVLNISLYKCCFALRFDV